ncbi:MAG: T9SS type A sorting domain-containing protein [Flavobacteriaceae bacterium]|nr:T9SS type A sorting domain-containing protein [Flavobacteriaceae bacterium]
MKTIFTFLLTISFSALFAQDVMFVHTATAGTISADLSYIDHPDLNGNPSAQLVVSHAWNPPGSPGIYNPHRTGLYYDSVQAKWGVYNEDSANIVEDSSYFIYIEEGSNMFVHIADAGNQGSDPSYTVLNHPDINGNPEAQVVITTYYNPNSSRNDFTYGTWYDGSFWNLYTEDASTIQFGDAFMVAINGGVAVPYRHAATAGTVFGNYTIIDHPALNGKPDAKFVFTHNWGESGQPSNVIVNEILGAWYTGSNWSIYTEDGTAFPVNSEYDLIIYDDGLGTQETTLQQVAAFPNPAENFITITTENQITQIEIFNILGQTVKVVEGNSNTMTVDISSLNSGTYMAKVSSGNASKTIKLIKV